MNDFIGFTFKGVHSSSLGIIVVSDGSRYSKNLLPDLQDYTSEIPGGDGSYYFGSEYKNRTFNINFAFDKLSELQIRKIKNLFNGKEINDLIFDEEPYKVFSAKPSSPPTLQFICFEENGERVYKGEGTLTFITFYPYARSKFNYLDNFLLEDYPNKNEWSEVSGMKVSKNNYDTCLETGELKVYNAGDVETDFILSFNNPKTEVNIHLTEHSEKIFELDLPNKDGLVKIDTKKQLILLDSEVINNKLSQGNLFKIPQGENTFNLPTGLTNVNIEYKHIYL